MQGTGYFASSGTGRNATVYNFVADVLSLSAFTWAGATTVPLSSRVAFGNSSVGLWAMSNAGTTTYRITWATDASANGANLLTSLGTSQGFGMGNDVKGVYGPGQTPSTALYTYSYAGNAFAASPASLSLAILSAHGCGNKTFGVVVLSSTGTANTNTYTYATDVRTAGAAISYGSATIGGGSIGNSTKAIFIKNGTSQTSRYTYSTNTNTNSTALYTSSTNGSGAIGASDGTTGLQLIGGSTTATARWNLTNDTNAAGAAFSTIQGLSPGVSSYNPGVNA
jgi:hypothetical protein